MLPVCRLFSAEAVVPRRLLAWLARELMLKWHLAGQRGGLSARAEADGDRPGLPWLVFGTGEVPVEHPADRVAGL